jgi:hypothetical protein
VLALDRTSRRWRPFAPGRLDASEQLERLLARPGGQGVAGSSPAVPTGRRLAGTSGANGSHAGSQSWLRRKVRGETKAKVKDMLPGFPAEGSA